MCASRATATGCGPITRSQVGIRAAGPTVSAAIECVPAFSGPVSMQTPLCLASLSAALSLSFCSLSLGQGGRIWVGRRPGDTGVMFDGFESGFVTTSGASIFTRHGGDGPAVLLLHGHPRTSATWHRVAPLLVDRGFAVICPDLRCYGRSRGPAPTTDHSAHSTSRRDRHARGHARTRTPAIRGRRA